MNEEQKIDKQMPKVTVGALIVNQAGKILLIRSPKWQNKMVIPGGHIEWGESIVTALQREIKEEVGISIKEPEFLMAKEFIFSEDYKKDRHIIYLEHLVRTDDPEDAVKLQTTEATEYLWLMPDEILERDDVEKGVLAMVHQFKKKKGGAVSELDEYKQGWQRALADYKNLQKEINEKRAEWAQMSELQVVQDFLPIYDNFKKAFNNEQVKMNNDQGGWVTGIKYIMKQFGDVLKEHKVEEIKTVGEQFDPKLHEAAGEEVIDGKDPGEIVREVEGGYKMGERVIKVAKVIIAK